MSQALQTSLLVLVTVFSSVLSIGAATLGDESAAGAPPPAAQAGDCGWDNGIVPNGRGGRAIGGPRFPNSRIADDVVFDGACSIAEFRANVSEDDGWIPGESVEFFVYADTGDGPGARVRSVTRGFVRIATGDEYFGRENYVYWIDGLRIPLDPGTYWIGFRNPEAGGSGTNYWLTSDGGPDGIESDTGWFSLDSGNSWSPEGPDRHRAFVVNAVPSSGACCEADSSCRDDVPIEECGARFGGGQLCADLDPPCGTGACCAPDGTCIDKVLPDDCAFRYEDGSLCEDLFPPCTPLGACCDRNGTCTDNVNEYECADRFERQVLCENLDPPCNPIGACCAPDGTCLDDVVEEDCADRWEVLLMCADLDPLCLPFGACCVDGECVGNRPPPECRDLGGHWFSAGDCDAGFDCADTTCTWDNDIVPNGVHARALSPPNFRRNRVTDDVVFDGACTITEFHANVIEDDAWIPPASVEFNVYADTGAGPGAVLHSETTDFSRIATGDEYSRRADYEYWIDGLEIRLYPGTYWIGFRNPEGSGRGTNHWMTSDGGSDGIESETGWFSLDSGNSWAPEGPDWHRAFVVNAERTRGACCEQDASCGDDMLFDDCDARFVAGQPCAALDPPCGTGACCDPDGTCVDAVLPDDCSFRYEDGVLCEDLDPLCVPLGACCARDGTCMDGVREDECPDRFETEVRCEQLDPPCEPIGACCASDGTCEDDVPAEACSGRFEVATFCRDLEPPCVPIGACCARDGICADGVREDNCSDRFATETFCQELDPPCNPIGACCATDGTCEDDVLEENCSHRWEVVVLCIDLDPPCVPIGACCALDGICTDDVREDACPDRFEPGTRCADLDPPCELGGACCIPCNRDPLWICDGDVNGDGQVNPVDVGLVQAEFGQTDEQTMCQYDVDCDRQINPVDRALVQALFGTCEEPRTVCDLGCDALAEVTCVDLGGEFTGGGTDCGEQPCSIGACCVDEECAGTMRRYRCEALGGRFFNDEDCDAGFQCP